MSERNNCNNKSTREKIDYRNGKIYKVWSLLGIEIYIGSSAQKLLSSRMNNHRNNYNYWKAGNHNNSSKTMVYDLFDKFGIENCQIELIEKFPCNDYLELEAREGHHQRLHGDIIVNKQIAGRTLAEYNIDNKDRLKAKARQYKSDNAEELKKKADAKYTCECGSIIRHDEKTPHLKTNKHQKRMAAIAHVSSYPINKENDI
jgi:hypothetical protein